MDPAVFGPGVWGLLYTAAYACATAPPSTRPAVHGGMQLLTDALGLCMGCDPCRETYLRYLCAHPVRIALGGAGAPPVHAAATLAQGRTPPPTSQSTQLTRACASHPAYSALCWVYGLQCRVWDKLRRPRTLTFAQTVRRIMVYRGGVGSPYDALTVLDMFAARACCADMYRAERALAVLQATRALAVLAPSVPKWGPAFTRAIYGALRVMGHVVRTSRAWTPVLCFAAVLDIRERLCQFGWHGAAAARQERNPWDTETALRCSFTARGELSSRIHALLQLPSTLKAGTVARRRRIGEPKSKSGSRSASGPPPLGELELEFESEAETEAETAGAAAAAAAAAANRT